MWTWLLHLHSKSGSHSLVDDTHTTSLAMVTFLHLSPFGSRSTAFGANYIPRNARRALCAVVQIFKSNADINMCIRPFTFLESVTKKGIKGWCRSVLLHNVFNEKATGRETMVIDGRRRSTARWKQTFLFSCCSSPSFPSKSYIWRFSSLLKISYAWLISWNFSLMFGSFGFLSGWYFRLWKEKQSRENMKSNGQSSGTQCASNHVIYIQVFEMLSWFASCSLPVLYRALRSTLGVRTPRRRWNQRYPKTIGWLHIVRQAQI